MHAPEREKIQSKTKESPGYTFWYSEDNIRILLEHRLGDEAIILPQTQLEHMSLLSENLRQAVGSVLCDNKPAVLPIHLHSNHWAGIVIKKTGETIQVIYNDPKGDRLENENGAVTIVKTITAIQPTAIIVDLRLHQQRNDFDCGPFTVENLIFLATASTADLPVERIRALIPTFLRNCGAFGLRDQHYRILFPDSFNEESDNSSEENPEEKSNELTRAQSENTDRMALENVRLFQLFFNPSKTLEEERTSMLAQVAVNGDSDWDELFSRSNVLMTDSISSGFSKLSEERTVKELMLRVAMQMRPQYFTQLLEDDTDADDVPETIFFRFFKEVIENGPLDIFLMQAREKIKPRENLSADQAAATLEFIEGIAEFLKNIVKNDPEKDPFLRYVPPIFVKWAEKLRDWLRTHRKHKAYKDLRKIYRDIIDDIKKSHMKALKYGANYVFSLVKRLAPRYSHIQHSEDFFACKSTEYLARKRQELESLVLEEYGKSNIFEPNVLRNFSERLQRGQYGEIFYQMVCESFNVEFKSSSVHQIVRNIWLVAHLDTINEEPIEAMSRMPGASFDGLPARNFGYNMPSSEAYARWRQNKLVCAYGDIVVDAFHEAVDFGCGLDLEKFLERFKLLLAYHCEKGIQKKPDFHPYDRFVIAFQFYLLEKIFQTPKRRGTKMQDELLRVVQSEEQLLTVAYNELKSFKEFSSELSELQPDEDETESHRGFVFGLGFNGEKFDSLDFSGTQKNEIVLGFSDTGRKKGGYTFLFFLTEITRHGPSNRRETFLSDEQAQDYYNRYRALLKDNISQDIQYWQAFHEDDFTTPDFLEQFKAKLENFMSQLKQDLSWSELSPELKHWICRTSNWYKIPKEIEIKAAEEMPENEKGVQHFARRILWDALMEESFSENYPEVMPFLFLHWKQKIKVLLASRNSAFSRVIAKASSFDVLEPAQAKVVLEIMDNLACKVHPTLREVWGNSMTEEFGNFMKGPIRQAESRLEAARRKVSSLEDALKNIPETSEKFITVRERWSVAKANVEERQRNRDALPQTPAALLSQGARKDFREFFFKNRDVIQCLEPIFARVLGHDRFFPIHISRKAPDSTRAITQLGNRIIRDVIAPCDKNCQHHVLGHLYVGDMLSSQSADRLDLRRRAHGLGQVHDQFMPLKKRTSPESVGLRVQGLFGASPVSSPREEKNVNKEQSLVVSSVCSEL